jgi:phage gp46-like protein
MPDIRLVQKAPKQFNGEAVTIDWLLTPVGALDESDALASAVILALGTDRLAQPSDTLPDPDSTDRRGWWGDFEAAQIWGGWPIGCRIWLMAREKITGRAAQQGATVARAEAYVREALQPFVDKRIASKLSVRAERNGVGRIDVAATLFRGPEPAIELRYADLWNGIGAP